MREIENVGIILGSSILFSRMPQNHGCILLDLLALDAMQGGSGLRRRLNSCIIDVILDVGRKPAHSGAALYLWYDIREYRILVEGWGLLKVSCSVLGRRRIQVRG